MRGRHRAGRFRKVKVQVKVEGEDCWRFEVRGLNLSLLQVYRLKAEGRSSEHFSLNTFSLSS
jgi:hypothetical protein